MPSIEQIRAARALLGWSQSDLADRADLSQTGIARIENGTNRPNSKTLEKIEAAFDHADIEFLGFDGVRRRVGEVRTLEGIDGFKAFLDSLYDVAKTQGGDIILHNAKPANWKKWLGEDWWEMHSNRMKRLGDHIHYRITTKEGTTDFISNDFAHYRWFPADLFNDQSIYTYGDKLAFVTFGEDSIQIRVLDNQHFARGFKVLFDIAWEKVAKEPG